MRTLAATIVLIALTLSACAEQRPLSEAEQRQMQAAMEGFESAGRSLQNAYRPGVVCYTTGSITSCQ